MYVFAAKEKTCQSDDNSKFYILNSKFYEQKLTLFFAEKLKIKNAEFRIIAPYFSINSEFSNSFLKLSSLLTNYGFFGVGFG